MRIADAYLNLRNHLRKAGFDAADDEARLLLDIAGIDRHFALRDPDAVLDENAKYALNLALEKRLSGMPAGRIAGFKNFYGMDFALGPQTLEPRADTEILVDAALPLLKNIVSRNGKARVLDIGTGTGAIGLALAHNCHGVNVIGSDIQRGAVRVANHNAKLLGLAQNYHAIEADFLGVNKISGQFDVIVSNPPYIRRAVLAGLAREVRRHDPMIALDGGASGLLFYERLAHECKSCLRRNGFMIVEIGYDQRCAVQNLFFARGWRLMGAQKDLGGRDRVMIFKNI